MQVSTKDSEIIALLDEQIQIEQETLEKIVKLEDESKETPVRLTFLILRLDTWKHVKFLEGMKEMLSSIPCDEWSAKVGRYTGRFKLERELSSLAIEQDKMVSLLKKTLDNVSDPITRLLLEHIKNEESNHSKGLGQLVKLIQLSPLQSIKGEKGTDIVCKTD